MPAIYAHYSFGKKVFRQLPNDLKKIAGTYKREYLAGLQGPDFLFFYNPLRKNRYGELGSRIQTPFPAPYETLRSRQPSVSHNHDRKNPA